MLFPSLQTAVAAVRLIRRVSLAVFALTVIFIGTSRSDASCGDYLHQGMMPLEAAIQPLASSPQEQLPLKLREQLPLKKPCHGPSCQQRNQHLPAPVPVVSFESHDRWMLAVNFGLLTIDQSTFLPRFDETVASTTAVFRLDRPPKA